MSVGWDVKWWPVSRITTPFGTHWISSRRRVSAARETSKYFKLIVAAVTWLLQLYPINQSLNQSMYFF